jgi:hypothetical protein
MQEKECSMFSVTTKKKEGCKKCYHKSDIIIHDKNDKI